MRSEIAVLWCLMILGKVVLIDGPQARGEIAEAVADESRTIFCDDFEDGVDRWEIVDTESWRLEEQGLGKSLTIIQRKSGYKPPVNSPLHLAIIREVEMDSFELTFKVKSTKDTGNHRDCCVFLNYQDPTHFYYVHLGAKPDHASSQIFIVNNAPRIAITDNQNGIPWSDKWHDVKLIRDSDSGRIALYFDDMEKPRLEVYDKTFGKGRIGLGSFDDMNAFDEVKLRLLTADQQAKQDKS